MNNNTSADSLRAHKNNVDIQPLCSEDFPEMDIQPLCSEDFNEMDIQPLCLVKYDMKKTFSRHRAIVLSSLMPLPIRIANNIDFDKSWTYNLCALYSRYSYTDQVTHILCVVA